MTKAAVKTKKLRAARVDPPTDLGANAVGDISAALNLLRGKKDVALPANPAPATPAPAPEAGKSN